MSESSCCESESRDVSWQSVKSEAFSSYNGEENKNSETGQRESYQIIGDIPHLGYSSSFQMNVDGVYADLRDLNRRRVSRLNGSDGDQSNDSVGFTNEPIVAPLMLHRDSVKRFSRLDNDTDAQPHKAFSPTNQSTQRRIRTSEQFDEPQSTRTIFYTYLDSVIYFGFYWLVPSCCVVMLLLFFSFWVSVIIFNAVYIYSVPREEFKYPVYFNYRINDGYRYYVERRPVAASLTIDKSAPHSVKKTNSSAFEQATRTEVDEENDDRYFCSKQTSNRSCGFENESLEQEDPSAFSNSGFLYSSKASDKFEPSTRNSQSVQADQRELQIISSANMGCLYDCAIAVVKMSHLQWESFLFDQSSTRDLIGPYKLDIHLSFVQSGSSFFATQRNPHITAPKPFPSEPIMFTMEVFDNAGNILARSSRPYHPNSTLQTTITLATTKLLTICLLPFRLVLESFIFSLSSYLDMKDFLAFKLQMFEEMPNLSNDMAFVRIHMSPMIPITTPGYLICQTKVEGILRLLRDHYSSFLCAFCIITVSLTTCIGFISFIVLYHRVLKFAQTIADRRHDTRQNSNVE